MPTVYTEVEVEVSLSDFDTEDLIKELESRGNSPPECDLDSKEIVESIYLKRRFGKDYQQELDQLIYQVIGKIV